jgi:hypothetical protein
VNAVSVDGVEVLPAGSIIRGTSRALSPPAKWGRASLGLQFSTLTAYDERIPISARWSAQAEAQEEDAAKIGIGAGAGAIIGSIIGGKKSAATGAAVGNGAGTAMC